MEESRREVIMLEVNGCVVKGVAFSGCKIYVVMTPYHNTVYTVYTNVLNEHCICLYYLAFCESFFQAGVIVLVKRFYNYGITVFFIPVKNFPVLKNLLFTYRCKYNSFDVN